MSTLVNAASEERPIAEHSQRQLRQVKEELGFKEILLS